MAHRGCADPIWRHPNMGAASLQLIICRCTLWWTNIAMERSTIFNGKIHYKWPFSIAMLVHQRVTPKIGKGVTHLVILAMCTLCIGTKASNVGVNQCRNLIQSHTLQPWLWVKKGCPTRILLDPEYDQSVCSSAVFFGFDCWIHTPNSSSALAHIPHIPIPNAAWSNPSVGC